MYLFQERDVTEENEWQFGQLVPVLLLLLPAILMLDRVFGKETQTSPQQIPVQESDRGSSRALDIVPPSEHPIDGLYSQLRRLCNQDFRDEPWYLDNLLQITSYSVVAGGFILSYRFDPPYFVYLVLGPGTCLGFVTIPTAIPQCKIVSGIQRRKRNSPFLIKLAVDPRKRYRVSRWIFCLWGSISAAMYVVSGYTNTVLGTTFLCSVLSWIGALIAICFYAFFSGLFSIYRQVLARNQPTDYTTTN